MSCQGCAARKIRCERREGYASCVRCVKKGILCVTEKRLSPSLRELVETAKRVNEEARQRTIGTASSSTSNSAASAVPTSAQGLEERFMLLRHVNSFMQQLHFKGSHADVSMLGVWRAALAPESEWATLKPQILFRDYVRGGVLARMFGNKQVEGMLLQAARPIAKELYETLDDADVVLGFHLLSRLLLTNDTRLAMHVGRTACSMARALSNPAVQLGSEEYKLATSMLQYTLMRLQGAGVRFSLSELEYSLHSPDPPELDPSSAQSVNRRFQYEFFLTKVEMARCSSLTAVIISKLLPSADLLQAPRIDNAPADAATLRALHNRIEQLTLSIDLVYKHKDELGLEGAWAYHNGLLHRLFVWCLLDRNDMAMNDLRHLALFFTYNESVFGAVPNQMASLMFHSCWLPMTCNDEATFQILLGIFKLRLAFSDYCRLAVPILEAAWNEYGAPTAAAVSLASLASPQQPPPVATESHANPLVTHVPATPEWHTSDWLSEPLSGEGLDPLFALLLD